MNKVLFRYMRSARGPLILTIVFGLLETGAIIVQMALFSKVVNSVFLLHQGLAQVEWLLLLLLVAIIVRAGLAWIREITAQKGAMRVKSALRQRVFAHLLQLGPAYCKGESTGELVTTVSEGIERLDAYVSRYLPQLAFSVLVPLVIVAYIFPLDWASAVILLVTGPVIPLLMLLVGSYAEKQVQRQWLALARMSAYFLDAVQGLPTLKLFGSSEAARKRVALLSDGFRERTLKMLRVAFLSGMVLEFMAAVAIGLVAVTLGIRLLNGGIPFESAFLILLLTPEFYRPLRELGVHRHAGMEGKAAAERIVEILETPAPVLHDGVGIDDGLLRNNSTAGADKSAPVAGLIYSTPLARPSPIDRSHNQLTITFTGVSYTYPGSEHPALDDISLTLPAGTCTALIGRSGAGKSTLVNLLLRFIDVQGGHITVNDISLAELPVELWREYVALVPQRPYLFYGNVLANIRLARPDASDEEVEQAAELAGAMEFIRQLPRGFLTEIGERGTRLSAGQAQRIAIARALLKDAPLLILDEPTSSLDARSELLIRQALVRLKRDRTVLVIAHRYNTIAHASQVAVLENGKLVEVGEARDLLRSEGIYTQLTGARGKVERVLP
ncbi:MAG TPA: thiol reductant ABC exporter subunit CydD [Ktedonobacteraceae bacterium]|nr:thiol reductant ABC exporter subunit CydD [Ktedonobacteraceae bacterium]